MSTSASSPRTSKVFPESAVFLDDRLGSLETGKFADFIVLDRDLLTCPLDDIKDTRVLRTYIDGKLVYPIKSSRVQNLSEARQAN